MQQCANQDSEARQLSRQLADTQRRVISMERLLGPFSLMITVDQTPESSIVPPLSATQAVTGSTVAFTVTWTSVPGDFYQAQTSPDAITWTNAQSPIPAAPAPATTTSWTSPGYAIEDVPKFRIRRFPNALGPC